MTVKIQVPGSKSITHRALILGAMSDEPTTLVNCLWAADTQATAKALVTLGARIETTAEGHLRIVGPMKAAGPDVTINCENSGTTLRLLLAQVARLERSVLLDGDDSLRGRPNEPLIRSLVGFGAQLECNDGHAPIRVTGPLRAGVGEIDCRLSSQYASALLMALPLLRGPSELTIPKPLVSRPYVGVTESLLRAFGVSFELAETEEHFRYAMPGGQRPNRPSFSVEGDWSTAAFPTIAALLMKTEVRLLGLNAASLQADRQLLEIVRRFGHCAQWEQADCVIKPMAWRCPGVVDLGQCPDLFPALAVLASRGHGLCQLRGAPQLRHKESDRISLMVAGLRAMGVDVEEYADGIGVVGGQSVSGATIDSEGDHRVLMAFEVLNAALEETLTVSHGGAEEVSYPNFFADLSLFGNESTCKQAEGGLD